MDTLVRISIGSLLFKAAPSRSILYNVFRNLKTVLKCVWPDFMATAGQRFILVALRYWRFRIDLFERKGAKENVFCGLIFAPLLTLRLSVKK